MKYVFFIPIYLFLSLINSPSYTFATDFDHTKPGCPHKKYIQGSKKSPSFNLTFWFSDKDKNSRSRRSRHKRSEYMKTFDTYAIFDFDREINDALANTKEMQSSFNKEIRLLTVQIRFLQNELIELIEEHKAGADRSKELLDTYIQLYELSVENYVLVDKHTENLRGILQTTVKEYENKTQQKIVAASIDPTQLVDELLDRYETVVNY